MQWPSQIKVLLYDGNSTSAINIIMALKNNIVGVNFEVHGLVSSINSVAKLFLDSFELIKSLNNTKQITDYCKIHNIKLVIPVSSSSVAAMSKHKKDFIDTFGIHLLVVDPQIIDLSYNKSNYENFLCEHEINVPKMLILKKELSYSEITKSFGKQFIVKNDDVSFGQTISLVKDLRTFVYVKTSGSKKLIVQQFIKGLEYSVDCYVDKFGKFIGQVQRIREKTSEIIGGICISGYTIYNKEIDELTRSISKLIDIRGVFNFQFIVEKDTSKIYLIDINPKYPAGGLPLTVSVGLNLPLIHIADMIKIDFKDPENKINIIAPEDVKLKRMQRYWNVKII